MANYTSEEVQAAVEKVVRSSVRHPSGLLGERQVNTTFSDLQEAAAGVYILYFNAPFYTVYLGTTRLADAVQTQGSTLTSIINAVLATDRLVEPVKDISPIANAASALGELEAAVAVRSTGFADISKVPAFRRYAQSLNTFIQTTGGNIKQMEVDPSSGEEVTSIVDTPGGARSKIPSLVRQLKEQQDETVRRAKLLSEAIEDFSSMNLPQVAARGVISRARQVLDDLYADMAAKDENARLENLRAAALDILTQQPLVAKYGASLAPSEFITTKGSAEAFSDATHAATPAYVDSNYYGPYPIIASNHVVDFAMDGGAAGGYALPLGYIAELRGTLQGPFVITAGVNDEFNVEFGDPDGVMTPHSCFLTSGPAVTAQTLAVDVNTALGAIDLRCEAVFFTLKYQSVMTTTSLGGNNARFTVMAGSLTGMGIAFGDEIDLLTGPNAGTTWSITALDPLGQFMDAVGAAPITPTGLPDGVEVKVGPANRILRLIDTGAGASLVLRRSIRLPASMGIEDKTVVTLGWYPNMAARSRPVAALDVATNIAVSTSRLTAETVFNATRYIGLAHSSVSNFALVTLYKLQPEVTATSITGFDVTFTAPSETFEAVDVGDVVVIRSTVTPADVNKEGVVTSVTTGGSLDTMVVSFTSAVTLGAMGLEIGPSVTFAFGDVLNIKDGSNVGRYVVANNQLVGTTSRLEVLLETPLPVPITTGTSVSFSVELGQEKVRFGSRQQAITSSITVSNPSGQYGAFYFFAAAQLPITRRGTTQYLRFLTDFPTGASLQDIVQFYETAFDTVSRQSTIIGLEQGPRVVKITPGVESTLLMSFESTAMVPFGRIRVAKVADFSAFKGQVDAWLGRTSQQDLWWRGLVSALTPILSNTNPTTAQVNNARNHLLEMLEYLTLAGATQVGGVQAATLEYALVNYKVPAEEPVDTLLSTFRNKGADRAIDLLLEGQFSTFFGLNSEGVSYSGTLLAGLRELAREDLPIRKTDRATKMQQKLIGTSGVQADFEFTADNADPGLQPDIPAGADVPTKGTSY